MPIYLEYELSTCRLSFFYDLTPCVDASAAYTNVNDLLCLVAPQHQHRIQIVINVKRYAWDCERWNPECQLDARQRPSLVRGWNGITAEDLERNFGRSMCLFKWVQRVHGRYWLEISCEMYLSPHLNSPRLYSTLHRCKGNYLIRDTK